MNVMNVGHVFFVLLLLFFLVQFICSMKKYLLILTCIILFSDMSSSASFCSKYFLALWLISFLPSSFRPGTIKICIYNEEAAITFAAVWHRVLVFSAIWENLKKNRFNNSWELLDINSRYLISKYNELDRGSFILVHTRSLYFEIK